MTAFYAGIFAGCITETLIYPIEYVKMLVQMQNDKAKRTMRYSIPWTFETFGYKGFYRGIQAHIAVAAPRYAVRHGIYEGFRKYIFKSDSIWSMFFSGGCTGLIKSFIIITPGEAMKVRYISDCFKPKPEYRSLGHCVSDVVSKEGMSGLYKGLGPTVGKISSNLAIRFSLFDY